MNCRLKKIIIVMGIISCNLFMTGCTEKADKSLLKAESLIKTQKDINGAKNIIDSALEKNPDDSSLLEFKEKISTYLDAKEAFYNDDFEKAKEYINDIECSGESTALETCINDLEDRIKGKEEGKKSKNSHNEPDYLADSKVINKEVAQFTIAEAFEIFTPYEEVSSSMDEYNYLMGLKVRTEEEEGRLEEIKQTILGASTISETVYVDGEGIFRLGNQHYLYNTSGKTIVYKVYKDKRVEKVSA